MHPTSRPTNEDWRHLYARSLWRLPALVVGVALAVALPLYFVRGMRLVRLAGFALVAAGAAALGFSRPFQTLLLALFLSFSGLGLYLPVGSLVTGLLAVALARALYDVLGGEALDLGPFELRLALGVLFAAGLTSMLVASSWGAAAHEVRRTLIGLAVFVAISQLATTPRRLQALLLATGAGMGVATLIVVRGLLSARGPDLLRLVTEGRFGGIHGDPNVQATVANCLVAPMLYVLGQARGWRRLPVALILILLIATVVLSQSRAGMAVLALLLVGITLRSRRSRRFALVGLAVFGLIVLWLPRLYWVRFVSIGQFAGIVVDRSLQVRAHVLEGGWDLFLQHPWLGVGLGNFGQYSPRFMLGGWLAHNSFLEVAASIGIFGVAAYAALLAIAVGMTRRAARVFVARGMPAERGLADAVAISIVAFVLGSMTLSIPFYFIFWVLLGYANAVRRAASPPVPVGAA